MLTAHLTGQKKTFTSELSLELQRFLLLWRYQHPVTRFALWWRLMLKRVVDLAASALMVAMSAPAFVVTALAVKLTSKGPVIYAQERVGRFGKTFRMYKFRTMTNDAENDGPVWAAREDDPRLTAIGGFLRRSHLDELPQLFNVLRGEMSLVGPRPERPHFVKELNDSIPRYDERLLIKPGMTGLAQVHYRYDQTIGDVKRKLRFDLLYIKRLCLTLDLRILAWTVAVVVTGKGIN